jgi:hypothetical protein
MKPIMVIALLSLALHSCTSSRVATATNEGSPTRSSSSENTISVPPRQVLNTSAFQQNSATEVQQVDADTAGKIDFIQAR